MFRVEKNNHKIKVNVLGLKLSFKERKFLNPFRHPVFRNDDVSVDSHLEHFKEFCEIFHKYGYTQLHAINLYGYTNCNFLTGDLPTPYEGYKNLSAIPNDKIRELSQGKFIGDNKELVDYINSIPDEIALHGLYHTNYSTMSYDEQYKDIEEGLRLLKELFPNKKVKVFVAPFNKTNKDTYKVCKVFGLRLSALEGQHLEDMIEYHDYGIKNGEIYRYHHHRFYPESTFNSYDLSLKKLDNFFAISQGKLKLPKICLLCDRPNWAHDHSAQEIKKQLSNDFDIDIKYVIKKPKLKPRKYDLIHVFFWGEDYYKKFKFPKSKIIKQVSSHRWQDNPMYGPLTPVEFQKKYLDDAKFVSCPSKILYDLLKDVCPNLFLIGKGYSPKKFYYKNGRAGEMSICWAGNIKDPVKGVEEILIPATKDKYNLNLASDLKHEELLDFYNSNDIYVVSSKNEADPLPLIESMACGCFPVANYVGIAPELIRHKENGYLVKERTVEAYQEAFEWCKNNIEYIREQDKKNAHEIYETRRWEIMAQGYKKMYLECLKGNVR